MIISKSPLLELAKTNEKATVLVTSSLTKSAVGKEYARKLSSAYQLYCDGKLEEARKEYRKLDLELGVKAAGYILGGYMALPHPEINDDNLKRYMNVERDVVTAYVEEPGKFASQIYEAEENGMTWELPLPVKNGDATFWGWYNQNNKQPFEFCTNIHDILHMQTISQMAWQSMDKPDCIYALLYDSAKLYDQISREFIRKRRDDLGTNLDNALIEFTKTLAHIAIRFDKICDILARPGSH